MISVYKDEYNEYTATNLVQWNGDFIEISGTGVSKENAIDDLKEAVLWFSKTIQGIKFDEIQEVDKNGKPLNDPTTNTMRK